MPPKRILTSNEIRVARSVFRNSLNYPAIRIDRVENKYTCPLAPGTSYRIVTPKDEINWPCAAADLTTNASDVALFIHELVHAWQYQNFVFRSKIIPAARLALTRGGYNHSYYYTLDPSKDLLNYNMEQQAQVIEDYFRIFILRTLFPAARASPRNSFDRHPRRAILQRQTGTPTSRRSSILAILHNFLANPRYPMINRIKRNSWAEVDSA